MTPKRIIHVFGHLGRGGAETLVMNLYRAIDRSKIQFDFIVLGDVKGIYEDEVIALGGRIFRVPYFKPVPSFFSWINSFYHIFKCEKYIAVHVHLGEEASIILHAAKKAHIPIRIAHSHSIKSNRTFFKQLTWNLIRFVYGWNANLFFAASRMAGDFLFGKKITHSEKFHFIKNGIDIESFKYDEGKRKKIRNEFAINEDTILIGHVGRMDKYKNQTFLLDIFALFHKRNPQSKLLLVGEGETRKRLQEKVSELNLSNAVIFTGIRTDTTSLFSAMDIFVLPSFFEALPVVGIEAQVSGLYCIISLNVSPEAKITEHFEFLPLLVGTEIWCTKMDEAIKLKINRKHASLVVQQAGWDIKQTAQYLEPLYLNENKTRG